MRRSNAAVLGLVACLTGCTGAATRFYTLEPAAPGAVQPYAGAPFRIDAVHVPASLDRPELVRDTGGGSFTVSDNDHWAAPVGELLRRVLTQDLAARLPTDKVIYPDAPKPSGASGLVVDVLSISSTADRVSMEASWTLLSVPVTTEHPSAGGQQHTLRLTTPVTGQGVRGNATELSALTDQMASAIAAELSRPTH